MSIHIGAPEGAVATDILLPGDPLRAKFIAENYLENPVCYNEIRGMLGYTGIYKGRRISVQGTGMGVPSLSIYVNELIRSYGVKKLIRVGTCGGISPQIRVRDLILAMTSCTDSQVNRLAFPGFDFAPCADFSLLKTAYDLGEKTGLPLRAGNILTADTFYRESMDGVKHLGTHGVLAVEMETTGLYTLAAKFGVQALSILTVSDHIFTGEETTAMERQTSFRSMIELGLETLLNNGN